MTNKYRSILFGLNYENTNYSLNGCVNDVINTAQFLTEKMGFKCDMYTTNESTTSLNIIQKLYQLAIESHTHKLKYVWIHYSGHGTHVLDKSKDELDGQDECIVPSDFNLISDDIIKDIFKSFRKHTKIIFVCDSCHSGTIGDLTYSWGGNISGKENNNVFKNKIICISGCKDDQTASDAYLLNELENKYQYSGAMSKYLLDILHETDENNIFKIVGLLKEQLKENKFSQIPKITSSYDLNTSHKLFPIRKFRNKNK